MPGSAEMTTLSQPSPIKKSRLLEYYDNNRDFYGHDASLDDVARDAYTHFGHDKNNASYEDWLKKTGYDRDIQAQKREREEAEASAPVAERGFIGDTASHLARGVTSLMDTTYNLVDVLSPKDSRLGEAARLSSDYITKDAPRRFSILRPDESEARGKEGIFKRGFSSATESLPESLAPFGAGAASGALAASWIPLPGARVVGGLVGGTAATLGLFGAGMYGKRKKEVRRELQQTRPDLSDEQINQMAHDNALTHAKAEVGGELAGNLAAYMIFNRLPGGSAAYKGGKALLKELAAPGAVKTIAKSVAKDVPFEIGSEVATAYFQNEADKKIGLNRMSTGEAMVESILPAVFLSTGLGVSVGGYSAHHRNVAYNGLNQGTQEERLTNAQAVAGSLAQSTGDKGVAQRWYETAKDYIDNELDIPLDVNIAEMAATNADTYTDIKDSKGPVDKVAAASAKEQSRRQFTAPVSGTTQDEKQEQGKKKNLFALQGEQQQAEYSRPVSIDKKIVSETGTVIDAATGEEVVPDMEKVAATLEHIKNIKTQEELDDVFARTKTFLPENPEYMPYRAAFLQELYAKQDKLKRDDVAKDGVKAAGTGQPAQELEVPQDERELISNYSDQEQGRQTNVPVSQNAVVPQREDPEPREGESAVDYLVRLKSEQEISGDQRVAGFAEAKKNDIYSSNIGGEEKFAIRGDHPRGTSDEVFSSYDEAVTYRDQRTTGKKTDTDFQPRQEAQLAEQGKVDTAKKVDEHIWGFADSFKPRRKAKVLKTLNKQTRVNGEIKTRKKMIEDLVAEGVEISTRRENKVKPLSRQASFKASQQEQDAHEAKIKAAGKKTVYSVGGYDVTKTEYDYAQFLQQSSGSLSSKNEPQTELLSTGEPQQQQEALVKETAGKIQTEKAGTTSETIINPASIAYGKDVNTSPTNAQKKAENYKTAKVNVDGLSFSIENPVGSTRSGTDPSGKKWSVEMQSDYGRILNSVGHDKDHVDIFVSPGYKGGASHAYVVNQHNQDGSFDEHKVVLGVGSAQEAMDLYNSNYEEGWDGGKSITRMGMKAFKRWVAGKGPSQGELKRKRTIKVDRSNAETVAKATGNKISSKDKESEGTINKKIPAKTNAAFGKQNLPTQTSKTLRKSQSHPDTESIKKAQEEGKIEDFGEKTSGASFNIHQELFAVLGRKIDTLLRGMVRIISQEEAQKILSRYDSGPKFSSKGDGVFSEDDIVNARPEIKYSQDGRVQGFTTSDGKVYLVQGGIKKGKAMSVLAHELGVHAKSLGFKNAAQYQRLLRILNNHIGKDTRLGRELALAAERIPEDTNAQDRAEELLAYLVENHPETSVVRRFIAAVKKFLVEHLKINPDIFSAADLHALALAAIDREAGIAVGERVKKSVREKFKSVDVNSPEFKRWFGDWEKFGNYNFVMGVPVAKMANNVMPKFKKTSQIVRWAGDYFATFGNKVDREDIGEVVLNRRSAKDSLAHGYSQDKAQSLYLLPDVIKKGKILAQRPFKRDGTAFFIAAPVSVGKKNMVAIAVIRKDHNNQRAYVHEVILKEKLLSETSAFITGADTAKAGELPGADDRSGVIKTILFKGLNVNESEVSKVTDDTGAPLPVYHGSTTFGMQDNEPWTFGAKKGDNSTTSPMAGLGHFFATERNVAAGYAGGGAGKVYTVFLNIRNPYNINSWELPRFNDREEAQAFARRRELDGYDGIYIKDEAYYVAFRPEQVKSAEQNTGAFDSGNPDIRYSKENPSSIKGAAKLVGDTLRDGSGTAYMKKRPADVTFLEKMLSSPDYIFRKSPAAWRVLQTQYDRATQKFKLEKEVLGNFVKVMDDAKKNYNNAYKKANRYLLDVDRTGKAPTIQRKIKYKVSYPDGSAAGFAETEVKARSLAQNVHAFDRELEFKDWVEEQEQKNKNFKPPKLRQWEGFFNVPINDYKVEEGEWWVIRNKNNEIVKEFDNEQDAVIAMIAEEQQDLVSQGVSSKARELVRVYREMTNRAFDKMIADLRYIIEEANKAGLDEPSVSVVDETKRWVVTRGGRKAYFSTKEDAQQAAGSTWKIKEQKDDEIRKELSLSEVIAQMADLRGSYFARQRNRGAIVLKAQKGDKKILEKFDFHLIEDEYIDITTGEKFDRPIFNWAKRAFNYSAQVIPGSLARRMRTLKKDGWTILAVDREIRTPESVFDAVKLVASMDAVLKAAKEKGKKNGVDKAATAELHKILTASVADIFKQRGYMSSRLKRSKEYWQGFEEDMLISGTQYVQGLSAGIAKRDAAKKMLLHVAGRGISYSDWLVNNPGGTRKEYEEYVDAERLDPLKQPDLYAETMGFIKDVLRNEERVDRVIGTLQGLAVQKFLAFRVSSAAVNATNMVQAVPATISHHTGGSLRSAFKSVTGAAKQYYKYRSGKDGISEYDRAIFQEITDNGWDEAQFNQEAAEVLMSKIGHSWNRYCELSMKAFGSVEKTNRAVTIFAAYKEFRKNTGFSHEEAMQAAKHACDRAHQVYGKATLPAWARGAWNPARLLFTFAKFSQGYALNMAEMGLKGDVKNAGYMLLSPAILAGAGASAATPVVAALASALGVGGDDPEEAMYQWFEDNFGSDRFARHGLAGLLGVNLKGSIQMNNPMPTKLSEVFGAPGAIAVDIWRGVTHARKSEYLKGAEAMLPTAFGSAFKAVRESTEGVSTGSYSPVYYGNEPIKANGLDTTLRFLSFNPARISGIREKQWREKVVSRKYNKRRNEINTKIKRYYLYGKGSWPEIAKEISRYNDLVKGSGRKDIPYITRRSIKKLLRRNMRANKTERLRARRMREAA